MAILVVVIISLELLVLAMGIERYLYSLRVEKQNSEYIKAIMSRNINDFIAATNIDKNKDEKFVENDEIDVERLSDNEFDKFIKSQVKQPK